MTSVRFNREGIGHGKISLAKMPIKIENLFCKYKV